MRSNGTTFILLLTALAAFSYDGEPCASGAGEPNETRTINYTYDNLNRIVTEDANDSSDTYGYLGSYTYDIVGNRLQHTVDCNSKTLVTDYTYDPNVNQLTKEVHDGPEYAFIWNDQRVYAYAGNGDGRITHYRIGNTDKDVGHIKAFFIGLPSKWSPWLFYAALILVPLAFLSPAAAGIYARMRKRPGGCKIRLSLYHRCVLVFLAYALLIGPFGFESLSEGATLYSQLATTDWASGDRTIEYEYDNNGSQTKKTTKETSSSTVLETTAYEYNLQNRMSRMIVSYEEDSNDVNEVTEYTYNDSGIRVKSYYYKTIDSGPKQNEKTKLFLIDAYNHTGYAQVLEQWSPSGSNPDITYTIGDDIITQKKSSGVRHFLYDGHGSTRQLIDNNENIINEYSYDAYGVMLGGNPKPGSPPATNLLYTGEHFDTNMQMYNLRARWYNQNNGRFNRMDTFAGNHNDPQSLHKYLYAHCNPVNMVDHDGRFAVCDIVITAGIIGAIVGFLLPAETFGDRIRNALFLGLVAAIAMDLVIVAACSLIIMLAGKGIFLLTGEALITAAMIAIGGTTFAAGAGVENSSYFRAINRMTSWRPWGYKRPTDQVVKVRLSRDVPKNVTVEKRVNRAYAKGKPRVTTIERTDKIARRREAISSTPIKSGKHRDEWPMAFTKEGGKGADVEHMDPHVNTSVGATIGNKLRPYPDGTKFELEFHDGPPGN